MIYKNNDHGLDNDVFGPFILFYEGPNEGGRQNWVVSIHPLKLTLISNYFECYLDIDIDIETCLMQILGVSRIVHS